MCSLDNWKNDVGQVIAAIVRSVVAAWREGTFDLREDVRLLLQEFSHVTISIRHHRTCNEESLGRPSTFVNSLPAWTLIDKPHTRVHLVPNCQRIKNGGNYVGSR